MDINSFTGIMDFIVLACGAYLMYGYYLLMAKGELKEGLLTPGSKTGVVKCKDLEGYRSYIHLRVLVSAIMALLNGGLSLLQDYNYIVIPDVAYYVMLALFFASLVWYGYGVHKAAKIYF